MIPWIAIWKFLKPFLPYIAIGAGVLVLGFYFHHKWYKAGYDDCEEAYQAAAMKAGIEFAQQLKARDEALEKAQGQVVEVVKWKTKIQTVYQNAKQTDPDCAAWASEPIRCGLSVGAAPDPDVPADP